MRLLEKYYDGESLVDLSRDLAELLDPRFSPIAKAIRKDEHGFPIGRFTIRVDYHRDK